MAQAAKVEAVALEKMRVVVCLVGRLWFTSDLLHGRCQCSQDYRYK